jgi:hypothetical protein
MNGTAETGRAASVFQLTASLQYRDISAAAAAAAASEPAAQPADNALHQRLLLLLLAHTLLLLLFNLYEAARRQASTCTHPLLLLRHKLMRVHQLGPTLPTAAAVCRIGKVAAGKAAQAV